MIKEILDVRTGKREQVGGSGGSTELKLVATGTLIEEQSNNEHLEYKLNNNIYNNKLYYVTIIDDGRGYYYGLILNDAGSVNMASIENEVIILPCSVFINSIDNMLSIYSNVGTNIFSTDYQIEVYELPFTLGGAE